MTRSSNAEGLLRTLAVTPSPELDIPLVTCPECEKRRPMTIRKVISHMRASDGVKVEYACATCGTSESRTVKPILE